MYIHIMYLGISNRNFNVQQFIIVSSSTKYTRIRYILSFDDGRIKVIF